MIQQKDIEILYQDSELVVINKPGGMLSVPGRGPEKQDCAASRLRHHLLNMIEQPAVHRLDMYTSGLMVFAITTRAHRFLSGQFEKRAVVKKYTAVVEGIIEQTSGEIRLPFRLDPNNRPLQVHDPVHGKMGITKWRKLETIGNTTRIEFSPLTGRTHQLRVHAAHPGPMGLGFPIVGDSLYGLGKEGGQMMLHASYLQFVHPETSKVLEFQSLPSF
ncbi:MAG: RluA family pseudouridine synthase [Desulfobulbaceae bacterium]|nr:RluA family pseudouridine synthase [Desulfobulbaceae bacterium]